MTTHLSTEVMPQWAACWPKVWATALPLLPNTDETALNKQLQKLYVKLEAENQNINLTRIVSVEGFLWRHVLDSWTVLPHIPPQARVMDVGTGAGFPALPVAMVRPDVKMTATDSVAKKLTCVASFSKALGLNNLTTLHSRIEDAAHSTEHRGQYDVVLARGVAALPTLVELTLPLLKPDGQLLALKTASAATEELTNAQKAMATLGGTHASTHATDTHADEPLVIVAIEKVAETPKQYPRGKNQPRKLPIG